MVNLLKFVTTLKKDFEESFLENEEIESEFKNVKPIKSPGFTNIVNITSEKIFFQIKHICNLSFQQWITPNSSLEVAQESWWIVVNKI